MVTVNSSTLRQNVFETIYDTLKANADSSSYGTDTQPTITAAFIDDDQSFPQIVVYNVDKEGDEYLFGGDNSIYPEVRVLVEIYGKKNKDLDILSDEIDVIINDDSLLPELDLNGYNETTAVPINPSQNKIRNKAIAITYNFSG